MSAINVAIRKLKDVCEIVSGSTPKSAVPEYWGGENKWVTPAELNEESFIVNDTVRHVTDLGIQKTGLKSFPAGTVLLSCRAPIGKTAIAGCEMYCNQGFKNLVCSSVIHNEYLYFFLRSKKEYLNSLGRGATFKEVSKSIVGDVEIPLPSIENQVQIANKMKKVVALITKRRQQLEKLDTLVKSQFVEKFGSLENTVYPIKKIEQVTQFVKDGTHQTPKYTNDSDKGFKFLSSKDITSKKINWSKIKYIPKELHDELYARLAPKQGDILLAKNGTTGVAAIVDVDEVFDIYVSLALLRPTGEITSKYFWAALNSIDTRNQFDACLKGIGVPNLHLSEIKKTRLIVPELSKQVAFGDFITSIDKSKFAIQQSLDKLELLQRSLMNQYFG